MSSQDAERRVLTATEVAFIDRARTKAHALYEGKVVPHHSCGAALAVTFNLSPRPYQSLRRGGITGERFCGSIRAGELILGELLGDPSPEGAVTDRLRAAIRYYQHEIPHRFDRGASPDYVCNNLTRPLGDFHGAARKGFCTSLTADVAALTAEAVLRFAPELDIDITSIADEPMTDGPMTDEEPS